MTLGTVSSCSLADIWAVGWASRLEVVCELGSFAVWSCACRPGEIGAIGRVFGSILRWERRSRGYRQRNEASTVMGGWRTLGGIRVERPRFWMKLILTAVWGPISINCCLCACLWGPGDAPGLQDDGGEMGVDDEVAQEAASFCRRCQAPRDPSSITASTSTTGIVAAPPTPRPPCLPYPSQLHPRCSHPSCGPLLRALWRPDTAHTRPKDPRRPAPRMRPPSTSRAARPRSAKKVLLRE